MKKIKGMQTLDYLMIVLLIYVLYGIDYSNIDLQDGLLVFCSVAWFIMLAIRLYIENFRKRGE